MSNHKSPLGNLITDDTAERDAVHVAICPAIAQGRIDPGNKVYILKNEEGVPVVECGDAYDKRLPIGVADPFLNAREILDGQRFYLLLFPNTITSLKHEWEHPILKSRAKAVAFKSNPVSKVWLDELARGSGISFDELTEATRDWIERGETYCFGDGDHPYADEEFWSHYQAYTGHFVDTGKKQNFFRCAC